MRIYWGAKLLLTAACCLAGRLSMAQRTAIAPLAPLPPVVRPNGPPDLGVELKPEWTAPRPSPAVATAQAVRPVWPEPVYLLNSYIILSGLALGVVKPMDIAKLDVYKGADAPAQWRSLTEHGIVNITLKAGVKPKFKTESLSSISRRLALTGPVSFELNGLRLEDTTLRVAVDGIAGLDVRRSEAETVVNIRFAPPKPLVHPPGTILIRGTAAR
ncbi:MAG: hypothetical protein ACRYG7_54925 [Janthinobacterium lividum]